MADRLLLLRHARIVESHAGRLIGATDVPLGPTGEAQARALAARVPQWAPETCWCSPMLRCRQTAAAALGDLPLCIDPDLREIDFGACENRTFADIAAEDASLVERWASFDSDFTFPGGESMAGFLGRVDAVIERLARCEAKTVLVVTHGGVIRAMICRLLGLAPRHYSAFDVPYAAMARIDLFVAHSAFGGADIPVCQRNLDHNGRQECLPHCGEKCGVLAALERPAGEAGNG